MQSKKRGASVNVIAFLVLAAVLVGVGSSFGDDLRPHRIPFSLSVSGGISLGSYEAGVNWALIEYLKRSAESHSAPKKYGFPDLTALTGASAGSINAVMSALQWAADVSSLPADLRQYSTVDNNLVRNVWVNVGMNELLPEKEGFCNPGQVVGGAVGGPCPEGIPVDAMFTRRAFTKSIAMIKEFVSRGKFQPNLDIPIGLMATRVRPAEVKVEDVEVHNQRMVFLLRLRTDNDGNAAFYSEQVPAEDPDLGMSAYLPRLKAGNDGKGGRIDVADLIRLLYASSAFPVAFSPVDLEYCTVSSPGPVDEDQAATQEDAVDEQGKTCPPGMVRSNAQFVDGGMFDNIPLGTARVLAETGQAAVKGARRNWYFFISPGNRRNTEGTAEEAEPDILTYGIKGLSAFVPGMLASSGDHELYTILRSGKWQRYSEFYSVRHGGEVSKASKLDEEDAKETGVMAPEEGPLPSGTVLKNKEVQEIRKVCRQPADADAYISGHLAELVDNYLPGLLDADRLDAVALRTKRGELLTCTEARWPKLQSRIQEAIRDRYGDRRIFATSRHFPITGAFLGHFGAFLDEPLRKFDYYAGVYDGVHRLADFLCQKSPDQDACRSKNAQEIYQDLQIGRSSSASTVFADISKNEHGDWYWASQQASSTDQQMRSIFQSLEKVEGGDEETDQRFKRFAKELLASGYVATDPYMKNIFKIIDSSVDAWYAPVFDKVALRLQYLQAMESAELKKESKRAIKEREEKEKRDPKLASEGWQPPGNGTALRVLGGSASLFGGRYFTDRGLSLGHSAPNDEWGWSLLPYDLRFNAASGGLAFSYFPQWNMGKYGAEEFSLALKLTPYGFDQYGRGRVEYAQADLYPLYEFRPYGKVGLGPSVNLTYDRHGEGRTVNYGGSVYLELYRTFSFTAGWKAYNGNDVNGQNFYFSVGYPDLPGLFSKVYHMFKSKP